MRPHFGPGDLTNGGTVGQQAIVPRWAQEGYKQQAYENLRYQFAQGLLEAIERCKHPVVVEISEQTFEVDDPSRGKCDCLEIKANLFPTRTREFIRHRYPDVEIYPWRPEKLFYKSWKDRIRILFTGSTK